MHTGQLLILFSIANQHHAICLLTVWIHMFAIFLLDVMEEMDLTLYGILYTFIIKWLFDLVKLLNYCLFLLKTGLRGAHHYAIADHGSLIVVVPMGSNEVRSLW